MGARSLYWIAVSAAVLCSDVVGANVFEQQPLTGGGRAQSKGNDPFTDAFAQRVEKGLKDWHVAGIAISIVDGNDTFAKGFGFATLPDVPATPETLWYVGSTTKAHTSATLATLIDSQNYTELSLGWDTPISHIIRDDFVVQDEWATRHLTLNDAASHRTGMTRHDQSTMFQPEDPWGVVKNTVRNLRNLPLHIEPRAEFHYNNHFYTVLAHVIETLTGKWQGDVMKELIWEPLGMNSTYFQLDDALAGPNHLSQGYTWHEDVGELKPLPYIESSVMNGAGAIISNVVDYAKWMRCLLTEGQPLSKAVHKDIRKPRMISDVNTAGSDYALYSLSWLKATIYGRSVYWHSGSTLTHGALVYWFPEENYGITMFANGVTPLRDVLMYKLIEDRFQVPEDQRIDIETRQREIQKRVKKMLSNATDLVYPTRPSTPLPPTLNLSAHAGTYEHAGYGSVLFTVGSHSSSPEETTLVAERGDRAWNETVRLEHVTGDWWLWNSYIKEGPPEPVLFCRSEFKIGPDGKIMALEVEPYDFDEDVSQGKILYKKVA